MKSASVDGGDDHSGVIRYHKSVGIYRVYPDIMRIPAPANLLKILAAIERLMKRAVRHQDFVVISRGYRDPDVVPGAPNQSSLIIDRFPVRTGVVRSPDGTLVFRLYQRENPA